MQILKPSFNALAESVDRALVYTASRSRGASPQRIHLLGSSARWPRADRLLESLVSMPVGKLDVSAAFAAPEHGVGALGALGSDPEVALAAGHALRGLDHG